MFKGLWLPEPLERIAFNIGNQTIDGSEDLLILFLPVEIIVPSVVCPSGYHVTAESRLRWFNDLAFCQLTLICILDRTQQASRVRGALQEVNSLHQILVIILRHEDYAASVLTSYKEGSSIVTYLVHVGCEIVAEFAIRNVCHALPFNNRTIHCTRTMYCQGENISSNGAGGPIVPLPISKNPKIFPLFPIRHF